MTPLPNCAILISEPLAGQNELYGECDMGKEKQQSYQLTSLNSGIEYFSRNGISNISYTGLKTGFPGLDAALGGGLGPGLNVLGAAPGTGKSTLAFQIARNVSKQGIPVIIFSLEMPRVRIQAKYISQQTFVNDPQTASSATEMLNAGMREELDRSDKRWENIEAARRQVQQETENIWLVENTADIQGISAEYISGYVSSFLKLKRPESLLIIVDYLQIIAAPDDQRGLTDKQIVDYNLFELRRLTEYQDGDYKPNIPMLLISSFNREAYNKRKKSASMADFKDSGNIEYTAVTLMQIEDNSSGDQPNESGLCLKFQKHRYGNKNATVNFKYIKKYDYIYEENQQPPEAQNTPPKSEELQKPAPKRKPAKAKSGKAKASAAKNSSPKPSDQSTEEFADKIRRLFDDLKKEEP